jgi:hypothetical protein
MTSAELAACPTVDPHEFFFCTDQEWSKNDRLWRIYLFVAVCGGFFPMSAGAAGLPLIVTVDRPNRRQLYGILGDVTSGGARNMRGGRPRSQ